jgi:hypothetical protein
MQEIERCEVDEKLAFPPQLAVRQGKRKGDYVQIGDVPRVDQRLTDKPIIRHLPKIRAALAPLRLALGIQPVQPSGERDPFK